MHYLAPFPIIFGALGIIVALMWLAAAGSDEDGGPDTSMLMVFGRVYIAIRVLKALIREPMSVLPAFGILLGSIALIWLGIVML
jgi:hypothetical protein